MPIIPQSVVQSLALGNTILIPVQRAMSERRTEHGKVRDKGFARKSGIPSKSHAHSQDLYVSEPVTRARGLLPLFSAHFHVLNLEHQPSACQIHSTGAAGVVSVSFNVQFGGRAVVELCTSTAWIAETWNYLILSGLSSAIEVIELRFEQGCPWG